MKLLVLVLIFIVLGCGEPPQMPEAVTIQEANEPNFPNIWPPVPKEYWYWWEDGRIFETGK